MEIIFIVVSQEARKVDMEQLILKPPGNHPFKKQPNRRFSCMAKREHDSWK